MSADRHCYGHFHPRVSTWNMNLLQIRFMCIYKTIEVPLNSDSWRRDEISISYPVYCRKQHLQILTGKMFFHFRGNSTVVSVSVYQAGDPGSRPAWSACVRKVEFYHCVTHSFPPVSTTGSKKAVHVLLCLCNNACKRSLAICRKRRALRPISRLLSVPIWPACVKQGR